MKCDHTRVLVLSYETFNNVGEEFLGDSTEYLARLNTKCDVERAQLVPSYKVACKYNRFAWIAMPLQYIALQLAKYGFKLHYLWLLIYMTRLSAYYKKLIRKCDKIILAVGMLKFKNQNFSYIYQIICRFATKYNKDVLFNAMSIAKEDEDDVRFRQLVAAINMPCVKGISTRDGEYGLRQLRKCYIKRTNIRIEEVGDPALWIPEVYHVKKNNNNTIIGVNLIAPTVYTRYEYDKFSQEQVEVLYEEVISELDRKGYDWALFCNGMSGDYTFGTKLIKKLGLPAEKLLPCPNNANEYLQQLKSFKAVFGARLHADISAFALGIPVVGLLWDSKLKYFSETMGIDSFFMNTKELYGKSVVERLEYAISSQCFESREAYKEKTKQFVASFVSDNQINRINN